MGSLSEAATVFDPERLIEIIQKLGGQLSPIAKDARFKDVTLTKALTLVDATLIKALPRVMAASVLKAQTGSGLVKWRLHSQFEVDRYVPSRIDVTRDGGGDNDERSAFERTIQADEANVGDDLLLPDGLGRRRDADHSHRQTAPARRREKRLILFTARTTSVPLSAARSMAQARFSRPAHALRRLEIITL